VNEEEDPNTRKKYEQKKNQRETYITKIEQKHEQTQNKTQKYSLYK
jgi:hypothetical protein